MEKKKNGIQWLVNNTDAHNADVLRDVKAKCKIEVDTSALTITVSAETSDRLGFGLDAMQQAVDTERSRHAFVAIPADRMPMFIGFRGCHIREFESAHDVSVKVEKGGASGVNIFGEPPEVANAVASLEEAKHQSRMRRPKVTGPT